MVKRLAVLAATLMSVALLVPSATATNSNQISIPFTKGKASINEIAVSVTKTTGGSTVGIPFTLTIANPLKLPSKIHMAAIGGLNGVTGAGGNTVLTYKVYIALDAHDFPALGAITKKYIEEHFTLNLSGGTFGTVKPGIYSANASCTAVGSDIKTLIKIGLKNLAPSNVEDMATAMKFACPKFHK